MPRVLPALVILATFALAVVARADEPSATQSAAEEQSSEARPDELKPEEPKPDEAAAAETPATEATPEGAPAPVSFVKDVAPLLVAKCQACHGPVNPESDYQVNSFASLTSAGASSAAAVTPGKPDESELVRLIASDDKDERMPKDADRLSAEQVALVTRWVAEGAKFDGPDPQAALARIIPRQPHADPPEAYRVPVPVTALAFRPDGQELAVGGYREVTIWNPADGKLLRRIKDVPPRTLGLAYSPDGKLLAVAGGTPGESGEVALYDPEQGTVVRHLGSMADVAWGVAFHPQGSELAACGADRTIRLYDVASGKEERLIEDHADWVMGVAFNHDGTRLASASRDKTAKLFDAASGESLVTYPGHGEQVFGVAFQADGTQVLTGGRDKKIHLWKTEDAGKAAEIAGFGQEVYDILVADGQIFACSADRTIRQFEAGERKPVRAYEGHADWVYAIAYSPATKQLASGGYDGEVRIWNTADGALVASFLAAPGYQAPAAGDAQQAAAK